MYSIRLNSEDMKRFKGICKAVMFKKNISIQDMSERTGYSVQTLYNFFSNGKDNRNSRFIAAALGEELGIVVGGRS